MKNLIPIFILFCLFSSCVTLFNRKNTHFFVKSNKGVKVIYHDEYTGIKTRDGIIQLNEGDEIPLGRRGAYIIVKRDRKESIPVTVRKDSLEKTLYVKPVHSWMYYANILHAYPLLAFGFLVDHKNPNRFGYPKRVFVYIEDTAVRRYYYFNPHAWAIRQREAPYYDVDITPPIGNAYKYGLDHLSDGGDTETPFGGSLAVNYHYTPVKFLSFEAGGAYVPSSFFAYPPDSFARAIHIGLYRETIFGFFLSVKNNYCFGRGEVGYGLFLEEHTRKSYYSKWNMDDSATNLSQVYGMGAGVSAYFRINSYLSAGVNYQAQLISCSPDLALSYQTLINVGIKWRIRLQH